MRLNLPKSLLYSSAPFAVACLLGCNEITYEKPNIVIIYADDIGYGDLSCYGATAVKTPNVDRLSAEGILFTNAYACAATSTPSRYGMLTGQYPFRRRISIINGDSPMIISKDQYTVASLMKDAGYSTAVIGKWHLGLGDEFNRQNWNGLITPNPSNIGFEYHYIMAATGDRVPCVDIENGRVVNLNPDDPIEISYTNPFEGEPLGSTHPELLKMHPSHRHDGAIVNGISRLGFQRGGKSAHWVDENWADTITLKAVKFIEENNPKITGKPFFLLFGTHDIHVPRVPHSRFIGTTDMGPRGDCIVQFDWSVGQILEVLDKLELNKNTLVVLSSDNGPVVDDGYKDHAVERLNEHKPWGPFRGGKFSSFEAGTRIPFIVRWPRAIKKSKISEVAISQIDLFGVMAQLTHQTIPDNIAQDSFKELNTWLGKTQKGRSFVVQQSISNTLSLVQDNWKYIEPSPNPRRYIPAKNIELGDDTIPQLYNLKVDPGESVNVAIQNLKLVQELMNLLEGIKKNPVTREIKE